MLEHKKGNLFLELHFQTRSWTRKGGFATQTRWGATNTVVESGSLQFVAPQKRLWKTILFSRAPICGATNTLLWKNPYTENGGRTCTWNVGTILSRYTLSRPRRKQSYIPIHLRRSLFLACLWGSEFASLCEQMVAFGQCERSVMAKQNLLSPQGIPTRVTHQSLHWLLTVLRSVAGGHLNTVQFQKCNVICCFGTWRRLVWEKNTDVLEEPVACIIYSRDEGSRFILNRQTTRCHIPEDNLECVLGINGGSEMESLQFCPKHGRGKEEVCHLSHAFASLIHYPIYW